jgi:hypothetical protein
VPVAIQRFANGQQRASGELVDISVLGARILSDTPLQFGEKLILHFESKSIDASISIRCQVQWIRSGKSEDNWTVGCLFEYHLEEKILEEFVNEGLLERRQSDRQYISLPASVKFEGVVDEKAEVDLYNIGTGGFCFQSLTAGTIGSLVRMTFDDTAYGAVEGRIMWQSADDGEYLVGCQWVNDKGLSFAKQLSPSTVLKPERLRPRLRDRLFGALVIAVVAFFLGVLTASVSSSIVESDVEDDNLLLWQGQFGEGARISSLQKHVLRSRPRHVAHYFVSRDDSAERIHSWRVK